MIKVLLFFMCVLQGVVVFAAGVHVVSQFPTEVTLFLDNGEVRTKKIGISEEFLSDAFFAGFKSIQWLGADGFPYQAELPILGIKGWFFVKIFYENYIIVLESALFHSKQSWSPKVYWGKRIAPLEKIK